MDSNDQWRTMSNPRLLLDHPYRIKHRRLGCENVRLKVFCGNVENTRTQRELVEFLVVKSKTEKEGFETGVLALPFRGGSGGMFRVYRHPVEWYVWEAPKGFIELGETAEQAACREFEEETALVCTEESLQPLGAAMPVPAVVRSRARLFAVGECDLPPVIGPALFPAGQGVGDPVGVPTRFPDRRAHIPRWCSRSGRCRSARRSNPSAAGAPGSAFRDRQKRG